MQTKLMTIHFLSERWHRLYVSRKEEGRGGRGFTCIGGHMDTSKQGLKNYIKKIFFFLGLVWFGFMAYQPL